MGFNATFSNIKVIVVIKVIYRVHNLPLLSDLRQGGEFFRVLRFPSPIKLTATINRNIVYGKKAGKNISLSFLVPIHDFRSRPVTYPVMQLSVTIPHKYDLDHYSAITPYSFVKPFFESMTNYGSYRKTCLNR
jgi:hypothetical protein